MQGLELTPIVEKLCFKNQQVYLEKGNIWLYVHNELLNCTQHEIKI